MRTFRSPLQKLRRLLKLLECLQSGQGYNARELAELCGVTRRQIFRDLRALQDSGIDVLFDDSRHSYRVQQSAFLPATELTLAESLSLLVLTSQAGDPRHGIPLLQPARDAALKIAGNLPLHLRQLLGELTGTMAVHFTPPGNSSLKRSTLDALHDAIRTRRAVRIEYHSLHEKQDIHTLLSPYRLLYSRRSWFAIGRSSLHRAVRMFNMGRILSLTPTADRYEIPQRFSLERYLGNAWHLIREPGRPVTVRIRFQPQVAENVADVLWHRTQRLCWNDDGTLDFSAQVHGIREISWWVLGYGDQAEVLEPPELRRKVAAHVQKMSQIYDGKPRRHGRRRAAK